MYPTILMFHQDMARSCLQYRYERMGAASKRAESAGYKGMLFSDAADVAIVKYTQNNLYPKG